MVGSSGLQNKKMNGAGEIIDEQEKVILDNDSAQLVYDLGLIRLQTNSQVKNTLNS